MTKLHYICVTMLLASALLFLLMYLYQPLNSDLKYATPLAAITSTILPDSKNYSESPHSGSPIATNKIFSITEGRARMILVLISAVICLFVIAIILFEKHKIGSRSMQDPLIAASTMLAMTIFMSSYKIGIFLSYLDP